MGNNTKKWVDDYYEKNIGRLFALESALAKKSKNKEWEISLNEQIESFEDKRNLSIKNAKTKIINFISKSSEKKNKIYLGVSLLLFMAIQASIDKRVKTKLDCSIQICNGYSQMWSVLDKIGTRNIC